MTFDAILRLVVPQGWFLPVTPGTKFVTVGGAIANDVHGKNHHAQGTLGRHVRRLGLLRSDGRVRICSPMRETDLFGATIGGLGLTGLIVWAEIQLLRIQNPYVVQEALAFENLEEFLAINQASVDAWPYTVSWVDCVARGRNLGRGVYFRGRAAPPQLAPTPAGRSHLTHAPLLRVPFQLPGFSLNQLTVGIFNRLYRWSNLRKASPRLLHYDPFFYPLDAVMDWNRIYGRRGFLQFQCVVPETDGGAVMRELLERIAHSGQASFLAVLKTFGDLEEPGLALLSPSGHHPGAGLPQPRGLHAEALRRARRAWSAQPAVRSTRPRTRPCRPRPSTLPIPNSPASSSRWIPPSPRPSGAG